MGEVSVVIPTMNRIDSLIRTVNKLRTGTVIPNELIIVDQSTDAETSFKTKQYLENIETSIKCRYVYQDVPSLTKARNNGMRYVSNEIVIQMDDDVDVDSNTIENIVALFSKYDDLSMVAGINRGGGPSNSIVGYIFGKKSYQKRNIGHVTHSMYGRFPQKYEGEIETEWAMGFFFVIRKSLFEKWNLQWDENLKGYAYAEDLDFSYNYYICSKKENLRCLMSDRVVVKHNVTTEWRVIPRKHTFMIVLHREYLSYKFHKNPLYRLATRWSNFGEMMRRLLSHQSAKDVWDAQVFCDRWRSDIKKGIFHYDLF